MPVRIYDTLSQSSVALRPPEAGEVGIYVCGLTVYDVPHVGHARAIVTFDVVVRTLRARGYRVRFVRNITDVDDRIIKRSAELGITPDELTRRMIEQYHRDVDALGCLRPDVEPRVTEHMPEIVALIGTLIEKGFAYERDGDVYYRVRAFPGYGKLSHRRIDDLQAGARVEVDERKDDPLDFALWKAAKPGEPEWPSPWGPGRPGWHIECSAMSTRYLGAPFDIHGGGMDLIFPHHENEIAQSEAAAGVDLARIWMHNGFVEINKEKMSKSLGNFITVEQALEIVEPEAVRYALLGTHYRGPLHIDFEAEGSSDGASTSRPGRLTALPGFEEAERRIDYCYTTLAAMDALVASLPSDPAEPFEVPSFSGFDQALDDDFNTAAAVGHLADRLRFANELCSRKGGDRARLRATIEKVRTEIMSAAGCLGILQEPPEAFVTRRRERALRRRGLDAGDIERRISERAEARAHKHFARADAIRQELLRSGVEIMDSGRGTTWRVIG